MRNVEATEFTLEGVSRGDVYFIAKAFYDEAHRDRDQGYPALAIQEFKKAYDMYKVVGDSYFASRCDEEMMNIEEEMKNV